MANGSSNKRWIILIGLILSQLGSLLLLAVPWLTAFSLTMLMMAGGSFYILYACAFPILPLTTIIVSWIFYARKMDRAAAILSGMLFVLSAIVFIVFLLYTSMLTAQ
jgi:hypothetical protein